MKPVKNSHPVILCIVAAALALASCQTKPPAPEPEPAPVAEPAKPEPAPEPAKPAGPAISQAELDDLLSQAKELKKRAFDLKLFEVLPDDYKAADGAFSAAFASYQAASREGASVEDKNKEAPAAKSGLEASIAAYKELIAKGVVALAEAMRAEADSMRATAVKAEADSKAVDRFQAGDEAYAAAAALIEGGKHEEAVTAFETARLYFELAYKRAAASDLRDTIAEADYAKWDSGNNQLAETKYAAEEGVWASGVAADRASGVDMLDEAILRFNLVTQKGREMHASGAKEKTDGSKAEAEKIKAQVAVKDQYEAALETYEEGVSKMSAGNFEEAAAAFEEAQVAFDEAYSAAADKRAKAKAAMEAAEAAAADSARKAAEADALVGQGTK